MPNSLAFFGLRLYRCHQEATLLHGLDRSLECVAADRIENDIHVFDDCFKWLPRVINEFICTQIADELFVFARSCADRDRAFALAN